MKRKEMYLNLTEQFNHFITATRTGKRLTPSGKRVSSGTIVGYLNVQKLLKEYENNMNQKLQIYLLHKASLQILKREKKYWHRFFISFTNYLYKRKDLYDRYVLTIIKILKAFFNYLQNDKGLVIGNFHKSFRIPLIQFTPVVLSPQQLQFLILNKEFAMSLTPALRRVKDIFIFGCTVGLRVSDLMSLKKTNIVWGNEKVYLQVFTQKTGTEIQIPLPEYAIDIIKKNKTNAGKFILPRLQKTNINLQLKKLIEKAGWSYTIPKYRSRRGYMEEIKDESANTLPFYMHITSHTMRRTAITTMLILGVPENVVRKLSGHAPGSLEFYRYVVIAQDYLSQEIIKAQQKLLDLPGMEISNKQL